MPRVFGTRPCVSVSAASIVAPLLAAVLVASLLAAPAALAAVPWIEEDFNVAQQEAKLRKVPLIIYFHTSWCPWCVELEDKVFSDEEVVERAANFVTLRIDGDRGESSSVLAKYKVSAYPTILVLSPEGNVLGRLGAYRAPDAFLDFLEQSITPGESLEAVDKRIAGGERSPTLLLRSAELHYDAFDLDKAGKRYEEAAAADRDGKAGVLDDALIGVARSRAAAGDADGAVERYRDVLKNHPDSDRLSEAFSGALSILQKQGRAADIEKLFSEFSSRFPNDPAVLNDQASRALAAKKDPAAALKQARRAVSLSPKSADYHATLARALAASGEPAKALDEIGAAIDLRPSDEALRLLRLEILDAVRKHPAPKR